MGHALVERAEWKDMVISSLGRVYPVGAGIGNGCTGVAFLVVGVWCAVLGRARAAYFASGSGID